MRTKLTKEEESLAVDLYLSTSADVDTIVAELWELQEKYVKARKMAQIGSVAEKFEVCLDTMSKILKKHGVSRVECPTRVLLTKKHSTR